MPRLINSTKRGPHAPSVPRSDSSRAAPGFEGQYVPPPEPRDRRMSAPVEQRTVNLWPLTASPVSRASRRPRKTAAVEHTATTESRATEALAAITCSYRQVRADIISFDSFPSAQQRGEESPSELVVPAHPPTVPLSHLAANERAQLLQGLTTGRGLPAG
jgi:hypothetical protein